MKIKEAGGAIAFQNDEGMVYAVTPISDVAGFLGASGIPLGDVKSDLDFIFDNLDITKLVMFIEEHQIDMIKLARKVGFKQEGRLQKATSTGDLLVFGQYR